MNGMIEAKSNEMQYYLADIDRILPADKIENDIYEKCLSFMKQSFKYSVYNVYHTYPFFKQMPPRLKEKLFRACMTHELKQMAYFFHDKIQNQKADIGLMRKIICALNCSMFEPGQVIIEKGKDVDGVFFIFEGYAEIMNTYTINDDEGAH